MGWRRTWSGRRRCSPDAPNGRSAVSAYLLLHGRLLATRLLPARAHRQRSALPRQRQAAALAAAGRRWGRACAAFTPGRLTRALERECAACGGALLRVGTAHTALSQHCLRGARVPKTLGQRTHTCPECGLSGDRDLVSATLAAFTEVDDYRDPASARVDYEHARRARRAYGQRLQAAVAESTVLRSETGATAARLEHRGRRRRAAARRTPVTGPPPPPLGASSRHREVTVAARLPNGQNLWDDA